jgi:thiol-disulfide isomerase/thioredoxin
MRHRLLLQLLFCLALIPVAHAADAPSPGDTPPNLVGKTLSGDAVELEAYRGKVVVLSFWATWCPYCLKELPVLEGIQKVAGPDQVQVIAVNTEERSVFRKAEATLKTLTMKLAYDPGKTTAKSYGVKGIPHLVIIGRDGKIVRVYRGYDESSLEGIVADLNDAIGAAE